MKSCPFCQAEIRDDARFCLYCMTPLTPKAAVDPPHGIPKRWWLRLTAVLVLCALLIGGVTLWRRTAAPAPPPVNGAVITATTTTATTTTTAAAEDTTTADSTTTAETTTTDTEASVSAATTTAAPTETTATATATTTATTTTTTTTTTTATVTTTATTATTTTAAPTTTTESTATTATTTTTTTVTTTATVPATLLDGAESLTWYYREATEEDRALLSDGIALEEAIVIVGFDRIPANGVYSVPAVIDGKTVVGIDMRYARGLAFDSAAVCRTVRVLLLPPTITRISYALFADCINLSDLYVAADELYLTPSALPTFDARTQLLTVHTSHLCWCTYGATYFVTYCTSGDNAYRVAHSVWDPTTRYTEGLL